LKPLFVTILFKFEDSKKQTLLKKNFIFPNRYRN